MPSVTDADLVRMRDQLFVEGPDAERKRSRFWVLLILSAVIASAGVIGDSTATVIGAMIVAPLMTPILGIVLAIVLTDRPNLARSLLLVATGAFVVVLIAYLMGWGLSLPTTAAVNGQVAARVSPRLIDLIAALATGAVGAVALARSDIADTLPGVAIAISLVPPLAVVGLTLESGAPEQAVGALLLFVTNVTAILFSGIVVMWIYGVHRQATSPAAGERTVNRGHAVVVVLVLVVVVALPLAATSARLSQATLAEHDLRGIAVTWAAPSGWEVVTVDPRPDTYLIRATGPLPGPDPQALRQAADAAGYGDTTLSVELVPIQRTELPAG